MILFLLYVNPTIGRGVAALLYIATPSTVRQVRAGVGFGTAEHSVKALQLALSDNYLGGEPDAEGKIPGYRTSFNFSRPARPAGSGHPYSGSARGMYLGMNQPPQGKDDDKEEHRGDCRVKFGGLDLCPQLAGVELNPPSCGERANSRGKGGKHPPSGVEGTALDTYAFETSLRSELENASVNRRTCDLAVANAPGHAQNRAAVCRAEVWTCGRCFCATPIMRWFDAFGRLRLTRL